MKLSDFTRAALCAPAVSAAALATVSPAYANVRLTPLEPVPNAAVAVPRQSVLHSGEPLEPATDAFDLK